MSVFDYFGRAVPLLLARYSVKVCFQLFSIPVGSVSAIRVAQFSRRVAFENLAIGTDSMVVTQGNARS
jgi:hypothetical protein